MRMGYTPAGGSLRVQLPLAVPLIITGVRLAAVTTIGLVTVAAIIGGERFGGLGQFITEGLQTDFDTKIYLGAAGSVLLALVVDARLVGLRALADALGRGRAGTGSVEQLVAFLTDGRQLAGRGGHPQPAPRAPLALRRSRSSRRPLSPCPSASTSATPGGCSCSASTSPTSAEPSRRTR